MKKVLATVAALGLVLGVAGNVLALDKPGTGATSEADTMPRVATATAPGVSLWSVSGQWTLAGAYLSNGMGNPGSASVKDRSQASDAFYIYSFKLLPVLQINDKIAVKGELRFADRDVFGRTDTDLDGGRQIDTYTLYMEWMSPFGKTRFGRTPAGAWGSKFLDSSSQGNRLMLWGNWMPENWGMLLFTQKIEENDAASGPGIGDQDEDAYYIDVSYKAGMGKTTAALWTVRHAENGGNSGDDTYTEQHIWLHGNYKLNNAVGLEVEARYNFGEASGNNDASALGIYADLSYKMDDWTFGGLAIYASGDGNPGDSDNEAIMSTSSGLGKDFNPFQIMTGDYMNLLNGDNPLASSVGIHPALRRIDGGVNSGARAIGLYAKLAVSPKTTLSGEIGYFQADEAPTGFDDHLGTEVGVGMSYKLYDNLTYSAHFSYLMTGDYFAMRPGFQEQTDDVYLAAHALSMKF